MPASVESRQPPQVTAVAAVGEAPPDRAATSERDRGALTDECFMTDSCGSCGQILLWCKCVAADVPLVQRSARRSSAAGGCPASAGGVVESAVWLPDDEHADGPDFESVAGAHLVTWTRTSLSPCPSRDRAPSAEGRELSEIKI